MSSRSVAVNRVLWALFVLFLGLALALWWWQPTTRLPPLGEPVAVEPFSPLSFPGTPPPRPLDRNVFDPEGRDWRIEIAQPKPVEVAKPKQVQWPEAKAIKGVVRLRDVTGILTEEGFVPVGAPWRGVTVADLGADVVVLAAGDEQKRLPLGAGARAAGADYRKLKELMGSWLSPQGQ